MKIIRTSKEDGSQKVVTLEETVRACEGSGHWKEGTVEGMLKDGLPVWTPFAIYQSACFPNTKNYLATYLVYIEDRTDFNTTVGPYESIESLKEQTMEVLSKIIDISGAPDGEYPVEATIEKDGNWYDSDSFTAVYKDGKVIQLKGE